MCVIENVLSNRWAILIEIRLQHFFYKKIKKNSWHYCFDLMNSTANHNKKSNNSYLLNFFNGYCSSKWQKFYYNLVPKNVTKIQKHSFAFSSCDVFDNKDFKNFFILFSKYSYRNNVNKCSPRLRAAFLEVTKIALKSFKS